MTEQRQTHTDDVLFRGVDPCPVLCVLAVGLWVNGPLLLNVILNEPLQAVIPKNRGPSLTYVFLARTRMEDIHALIQPQNE
jgi:hypothetical protein